MKVALVALVLTVGACGPGLTENLSPGSAGMGGTSGKDGAASPAGSSGADGAAGAGDGGDGKDPDADAAIGTGGDASVDGDAGPDADASPDADAGSDVPLEGGAGVADGGDARDAGDDAIDASDADAELEGDAAPEAGPPKKCSPSDPFAAPQPVPGLNGPSGSVFSARFSPDELTAYLGMFHGSNIDIYVASRDNRFEPFGTPSPVNNVGSAGEDDFVTVTADGLALYMQSNRTGRYGLWAATRAHRTEDFSPAIELSVLNTFAEGVPFVLPDGSALYYESYRSGNFDLYRAVKTSDTFAAGEPVKINTNVDETAPVVTPDELTIFFARPSNATHPIWMATRKSTAEDFSEPVNVTELEGPLVIDAPTWVSPDGCRLYLQEQDKTSGFWVYVAERVAGPRN